MFLDPIVEEVRATREKLAARFDFDLRRIVEASQERQKHSSRPVVSFVNEPDDERDVRTPPRKSGPFIDDSGNVCERYRDPIVEEVRAVRERLAAECDYDVQKIFERSRQNQARSKATIVNLSKHANEPSGAQSVVVSAVKGE